MVSFLYLFKNFKFISNAPNGFEHPFVARTLKLFAKTLDVNVNRSGVAEIVEAPNLVEKLVSCEYAVVVGSEEVEKLQLLGGDVDGTSLKLKLILLEADLNILEAENLLVAL